MAKTFKGINGEQYELNLDNDIWVEVNEDILTGDITAYFVVIEEFKVEVDKKTYTAVEAFLNK